MSGKKDIDTLIKQYEKQINQICVRTNEKLLLGWVFKRSSLWCGLSKDVMKYASLFLPSWHMNVYLFDIYKIVPQLHINNIDNALKHIENNYSIDKDFKELYENEAYPSFLTHFPEQELKI